MCRHQTSREKFLSAGNSLPVFPQSSVFFKKTFPRKFLPEVPYQEACPINQQAKENWYRKKSIVIPVQCLYK
jgi:hypothetical protein